MYRKQLLLSRVELYGTNGLFLSTFPGVGCSRLLHVYGCHIITICLLCSQFEYIDEWLTLLINLINSGILGK